jgi:hypothetical protein
MKSPQVESAAYISSDEKRRYSDLLVHESRAGFYVGTTYNGDHGPEPGSRDSGYFPTREKAAAALCLIVSGKLKTRLEP